MAKVLVVDDDAHIREVVRFALEQVGHRVAEAADGHAALRAFAQDVPDVVVLDILMPELDGLEVCRELRQRGYRAPILFLSSRDDELDRVLGLELGADDYVTKPFSPRELSARIKAMLRRASHPVETDKGVLRHGALSVDAMTHRVTWAGAEVLLTVTEFSLLEALAARPGQAFSRDQLVDRAWGADYAITDRTVDSHIRRVRKKFEALGADPIETVYGLGYRLREPSE